MKKLAKVLSVLTAACLLFGLYCHLGSQLQIEYVRAEITPGAEMADTFKNLRISAQRNESGVETFSEKIPASADDCFFLTLTFRLKNYGPLTAEWLSLHAEPESGDILQVLGSEIDVRPLSNTEVQVVLLVNNGGNMGKRNLSLSYYILGRKMKISYPPSP